MPFQTYARPRQPMVGLSFLHMSAHSGNITVFRTIITDPRDAKIRKSVGGSEERGKD